MLSLSPWPLLAAASLLLGACGAPEPDGAVDGGPEPDPDPIVGCTGDVRVVRVAAWPGRGLAVTLGRATPDGGALAEPVLEDGDGGAIEAERATPPDAPGLFVVLLVASPAAQVHAQRREAAALAVAGAPAGDRVAVYRSAADGLVLLADLTPERAHALERLGAVSPGAAASAGMLEEQAGQVRAALAAVDPAGALHRTLVVVGAEAPPAAAGYEPIARYGLVDPAADGAVADAVQELLDEILARRRALVRLGACPGVGQGAALVVRSGDAVCTFTAPAPIAHLASSSCDAGEAARDQYPYPRSIELVLSGEQRAVYDDRVASSSREPFEGQVRLGEGEPVPMHAHLRGHTSFDCERRSYSVDLEGSAVRRLLPGAEGDRFFLISMCQDEGYFGQRFAARLLSDLGLFPLADGYVRLLLDGEDAGVYLLVEQPEQGLVRDLLDPRAVVRRRADPEDEPPEIKFPDDRAGAAEAAERYRALVTLSEDAPAAEVGDALAEQLDLDQYLRWLAASSFLQIGDYVDEAFFYASEEEGTWYFRTMAWDPKDIYSPCHHSGAWAISDPCDLLYCAEADLDRAVVRAPELYRRFQGELAEASTRWPAEELRRVMEGIRDELWAALDDDRTAAAMIELAPEDRASAAAARAFIQDRMDAVLAAAERRRADLVDLLASCPEAGR